MNSENFLKKLLFQVRDLEIGKFWQIFFECQYILLCCPFRITTCPPRTSSSFRAVVWFPQKVLCAILAVTNLFWMQHYVRKSIPNDVKTPSEYLHLISQVKISILKLTLMKVYWTGQKDIENIINFLPSSKFLMIRNRVLTCVAIRLLIFLWCITYPVLMIIEWICWVETLKEEGISWMATMGNIGRKAFFVEYFTSEMPPNHTVSPLHSVLAVIVSASQFNQEMYYLNMPIITFLPLLTLWLFVKSFTDKLKMGENDHLKSGAIEATIFTEARKATPLRLARVMEEYEALKKLSTMLNFRFGLTFTCFAVYTIFYYSTEFSSYFFMSFDDAFKILNLVYLIINCCSTSVIFALSGDICVRVGRKYKKETGYIIDTVLHTSSTT